MDLDMRLSNRPIFVTGADGFVGSHLVDRLLEAEATVHAFVEAQPSGQSVHLDFAHPQLRIHRGDLRDPHSVRRALEVFPDSNDALVLHLGAQSHVGESWERPYETVDTNVRGTLTLLQTVIDLDLDLERFLTAGSSEEYGNPDPALQQRYRKGGEGGVILDESSPLNPQSIYATTKVTADLLTMNYVDAYGLSGVVSRMFNNFGPRQNPRFFTGTVITQALERNVVEVGNVSSKRDMCYISDGVRGLLHTALAGASGECYVFGYGENVSMREWAHLILERGQALDVWGECELVQRPERFRPGDTDVQELLVDHSRLTAATGWQPQVEWREGLDETIRWYANHQDRWSGAVDWR